MTYLKAVIDKLALTGLTGGCVIQEVAQFQDGQIGIPFISVSPYGPEQAGEELNDVDGHYYGTAVIIMAKNDTSLLEQRLAWRQTLWRNFNNVSLDTLNSKFTLGLPSIGMNYTLKVEPGNSLEPQTAFDRKGFISGMIVRARFQEPRS
jgi:hypothetical protein